MLYPVLHRYTSHIITCPLSLPTCQPHSSIQFFGCLIHNIHLNCIHSHATHPHVIPVIMPADWVSRARSALYQRPSSFNMLTMQQAHSKAQAQLFHCYRPDYSGPPQQLPASLAHPAFGHFRDALANKEKMPSRQAQETALELARVLSRCH